MVEVASGDQTYTYIIEAPSQLGDGQTLTVTEDLANILVAAEQSLQQVWKKNWGLTGLKKMLPLNFAAWNKLEAMFVNDNNSVNNNNNLYFTHLKSLYNHFKF